MSAAETEAVIHRYYEAFNRGDINGMLECVTDDVIHDVNQGERRQGKDKLHAFLARMQHHYKERLLRITVMTTPDGERAAAEFNVEGQYLATETGLPEAFGQRYGIPCGAFFAIRDGKIARVTGYYNVTEWILQVSEGP